VGYGARAAHARTPGPRPSRAVRPDEIRRSSCAERLLQTVQTESARVSAELRYVSAEPRDVAEKLGNVPQEPRNVAEELGSVAEKLRYVLAELRCVAEELRNLAESRGKAGELQKNSGESRGKAGGKLEKGSAAEKNALTFRRNAGGGRDYSSSSSFFLETMAVNSIT
jgi:hypothetical protein